MEVGGISNSNSNNIRGPGGACGRILVVVVGIRVPRSRLKHAGDVQINKAPSFDFQDMKVYIYYTRRLSQHVLVDGGKKMAMQLWLLFVACMQIL